MTPQGTLKVLVIFAGFTNDIDANAPFYLDPNGNNPWPQKDATHPVAGTTFPKNINADFYDTPASFSPTATDHSLSNLYYQMSQHSAKPFKVQAVFFPKRINVTANAVDNSGAGFYKYTNDVLQAIKNDPDTQNFNFSQVDQRAGTPGFNFDNSTPASDNIIDYTVIIWRNTGSIYLLGSANYGNAGWAYAGYGPGYVSGIPSANGQSYTIGEGFTQAYGMSGLNQDTFVHEFAHTLYDCPHYFGANRSEGLYFNISEGPGMMGNLRTHFFANAWERWYLGWTELQTGAAHVSSDVQGTASLAATNGEYTLRDYVTTGDAIRIKLPNSTQYLWLENHQFKSALDGRPGYHAGARTPPNPIRDAPTGIIAMVEDLAESRSSPYIGYIVGCNGLKVVSAQGNFDYTQGVNLGTNNSYFWHNGTLNDDLYNFTNPVANPFGGESQITRRRIDLNGNGIILTNQHDGNVDYGNDAQKVTESTRSFILNNANEDGIFGPDAAFNTVGQKLGNSYNPAIFEQQHYDLTTAKLTAIKLGGLSVELIAKNAAGDITVKVRYDDVNVVQSTRWSGDLQMTDVPGAANGADVVVNSGQTLTINKSGTNNRHTKLAGAFINPTTFVCGGAGVLFLQNGGSTVNVEGANTAFQVKDGGELKLGSAGTFAVQAGAVLDVQSGGIYTGPRGSTVRIEAGGSLVVRSGGKLRGTGGLIQVQAGAYLCVETGADLTDGGLTLNVAPGAIIGTSPARGLPALDCTSQLQFCGKLTGGTPNLSTLCPTGNEALAFDGNDDRVTIPTPPLGSGTVSPIHSLDQAFTIEAAIVAATYGRASQPIFSTRLKNANGLYDGLLFTVYDNNTLLLQVNEQNYYSPGDPTRQLTSGCHHVAVTRDNTDRVRFYIDGRLATYSPVVAGSVGPGGAVFLGGDVGYFSDESFNGRIGEIRVWNTTRTAAELQQYAAASLAVPQAGLVGLYDFRDPAGQAVADGSGIYWTSEYAPNGYLGNAASADAHDPAWVTGASLTCSVYGNFRPAPGRPSLLDTLGRTHPRPVGVRAPAAGPKRLSNLTLSPNPASGEAVLHFQLRDAGPATVSVQDLAGLARATVPLATTVAAGAHDVRLPLQGLRPGVYAVVVGSADGRQVIRLEVQ